MELEQHDIKARSILHVTVGIPGQWEPTDEELEAVTAIFKDALDDPKGAVVATRTGIESHVLPIQGDPVLEVTKYSVNSLDALNNTTLSVDMPYENLEFLARRIGVSAAVLQQASIVDADENMIRLVQSIDLATGEAILNVATSSNKANGAPGIVLPAVKIEENTDATKSVIIAHANLSGCYLTFPHPVGAELGHKPKLIPIKVLQQTTDVEVAR